VLHHAYRVHLLFSIYFFRCNGAASPDAIGSDPIPCAYALNGEPRWEAVVDPPRVSRTPTGLDEPGAVQGNGEVTVVELPPLDGSGISIHRSR
jgi:hypothetical protein